MADARGGTITYSGGRTIHTFTESGTFSIKAGSGYIDYLVGGGGGAGGGTGVGGSTGGGGAGGFVTATDVPMSAGDFSIVIGAGGTGGSKSGNNQGGAGGNSTLETDGGTITGYGGGGGGTYVAPNNGTAGSAGGCGGGGALGDNTPAGGVGSQGYNGGAGGTYAPGYYSAGGGGMGSAGVSTTGQATAGDGGDGFASSITGAEVYYGGGGGGGTYNGALLSTGGSGGGGAGARFSPGLAPVAGTDGLGGGGGGAGYTTYDGADGGDGVVIISYVTGSLEETGFEYYTPITINSAKVEDDLVNFPVLIAGTFDGTDGEADIRTVANGGKVENTDSSGGATGSLTVPADFTIAGNTDGSMTYNFEIEYYDAETGKIALHCQIPQMDADTDITVYMCYGQSLFTESFEAVNDTWDSGYRTVSHMADLTTSTIKDSTSYNKTLNKSGANTPIEADGEFGYMQDFALNDYVLSADRVLDSWDGDYTVEFVVTPETGGDIFEYGHGNDAPFFYAFLLYSSIEEYFMVYTYDGTGRSMGTSASYPASSSYVVSYSVTAAGSGKMFVNGSADGTGTVNTSDRADAYDKISIGAGRGGTASQIVADIEEMRFSQEVRSDAWIKTTQNTLGDPSTFLTFGKQVSSTAGIAFMMISSNF